MIVSIQRTNMFTKSIQNEKQKEDRLTRRPSTFREACFPRKYNMIEWTGKTRNRRTESLDGFTLE